MPAIRFTDHSSVLAGAAFRSTLACLLVFAVALAGIGAIVITSVRAAMINDLNTQIAEEIILFSDIAAEEGRDGLVSTVETLARTNSPGSRIVGVFDEDGGHLAGRLRSAPAVMGAGNMRLPSPPARAGEYRVQSAPLPGGAILVVARSMDHIAATSRRLAETLALAGLGVMAVSVVVGYAWSRNSMDKLARLAATLDEVSRGDTAVRVPIDPGNDQIDRIARQINAHLDRLAALTETTRNSVIAIAHDLRTPLNRAFLSLELASDESRDLGERRLALEEARGDLQGLSDTFDTVLRIARIGTAAGREALAPVALDTLAADIVETYAAVLEGAGQSLVFLPPSQEVVVDGDRQMLWQMLANLVENASLHGPEGTHVTIRVGSDSGEGFVAVDDDGPGIPPGARADVLRPFLRLAAPGVATGVEASAEAGGAGLGLALVKAIADRHHATLTLSDNAPGLRVEVRFPRRPEARPHRPSGPRGERANPHGSCDAAARLMASGYGDGKARH